MGKVVITVTEGANTWTETFDNFPVARLLSYAKIAHADQVERGPGARGGEAASSPPAPIGKPKAIKRWARGVMKMTRDQIQGYEGDTAKAEAIKAVTVAPIDLGAEE